MSKNNSKALYKTTIVGTKNKQQIEAAMPDDAHQWSLHSVNIKKNKAYYTWVTRTNIVTSSFTSSDAAFQKSLEMVKSSPVIKEKEEGEDANG